MRHAVLLMPNNFHAGDNIPNQAYLEFANDLVVRLKEKMP